MVVNLQQDYALVLTIIVLMVIVYCVSNNFVEVFDCGSLICISSFLVAEF